MTVLSQAPSATLVAEASFARVNLLPPEIGERRQLRRLQYALATAGLATVGVVAALWLSATGSVGEAQEELDAAQAQRAKVQQQVNELDNVRATYERVASTQALVQQALANEVLWSRYLTDLGLRRPERVWLTKMSVTLADGTTVAPGAAPAPAAGATGTGGLAAAEIGSITFTGVAYDHDDVAAWLEALAKEKGWSNPYFSISKEKDLAGRTVVDFTSTVTVDSSAINPARRTNNSGS